MKTEKKPLSFSLKFKKSQNPVWGPAGRRYNPLSPTSFFNPLQSFLVRDPQRNDEWQDLTPDVNGNQRWPLTSLLLRKQAQFQKTGPAKQLCLAIRAVQMTVGRQLSVASEIDFHQS